MPRIGLNASVTFTLTAHEQARSADVEPDTPLLWVLRETLVVAASGTWPRDLPVPVSGSVRPGA